MGMIATQPITGPTVWRAANFADDQTWIFNLSANHIAEVRQALSNVKKSGLTFPHFGKREFALPTLGPALKDIMTDLETGPGFQLLRGIPVEATADADNNIICWELGLYMGKAVRQNPQGDLIGRVMNVGDLTDRQTRVYETNTYLPYHTDPTDVVGLLCIRKAKSGGTSSLFSLAALYNEILATHPQYLPCLYKPMFYPRLGGDQPGTSPVFSYHKGQLTCRYPRQHIELGHEMMGAPLSSIELEAFDAIDTISHDASMRIDMMMEPGDMQLVNNYAVMYSRTSFADFDQVERRRKKLRLWLRCENARELVHNFPGREGFPAPN